MTKTTREKGQALLMVLLAMAVIVTIVLSIASRSTMELRVTSKEEESLRAFSAAEAGIEEALIADISLGDTRTEIIGDAEYTYSVAGFPVGSRDYNYPRDLVSGDVATIWFMEHDADNNLFCGQCYNYSKIDVCWGEPNSIERPAVIISVFYEASDGSLRVARAAYDSDPARVSQNGFRQADSSCRIKDTDYAFAVKNLDFRDMGLTNADMNRMRYMRVRVLYNGQPTILGVRGQGAPIFPVQGRMVESTGVSGQSSRKVEVFTLYPEPISILDSAIFSGGDIIH